jgi:hypothetical protein
MLIIAISSRRDSPRFERANPHSFLIYSNMIQPEKQAAQLLCFAVAARRIAETQVHAGSKNFAGLQSYTGKPKCYWIYLKC